MILKFFILQNFHISIALYFMTSSNARLEELGRSAPDAPRPEKKKFSFHNKICSMSVGHFLFQ